MKKAKNIFFLLLLFIFSCAQVPSQHKVTEGLSQQEDDRVSFLEKKLEMLEERLRVLEEKLDLEKEVREKREYELKEWIRTYIRTKVNVGSLKNKNTSNSISKLTSIKGHKKGKLKKHQKRYDPFTLYQHALKTLLVKKDSKAAKDLFAKFIKLYPRHKLIPNCYYWLGECYYSDKNYPKAIQIFIKVSNGYPNSVKASDALLKIGYSYYKLKQFDNANFYLNRLIKLYPNSACSILAKRLLKKIENES